MSAYGLFQPSRLGMESQTHALGVIANNIANVTTHGFKRTDVHFETVLSRTFSSQPGPDLKAPLAMQSDIGGVVPRDFARISEQGQIGITDRTLDLAINGRGFFILSPEFNGPGRVFGRAGSFGMRPEGTARVTASDGNQVTVEQGYLVDGNGYFVLGWQANADGTFPSDGGGLSPIRIDPYAFSSAHRPTTDASLSLNLPASDRLGDSRTFAIDVYDSAGVRQSINLTFTKGTAPGTWGLAFVGDAGDAISVSPTLDVNFSTAAGQETRFETADNTIEVRGSGGGSPVPGFFSALSPGDSVTIAGSGSNNGIFTVASVSADGSTVTVDVATPVLAAETNGAVTDFWGTGPSAEPLAFDSLGQLIAPPRYAVNVAFNGGATAAFTLDVSQFTQFAGDFQAFAYDHNGYPDGELDRIEFDALGHVIGVFDNGVSERLYKLAFADFANPDGLAMLAGTVFAATEASGMPTVAGAGEGGIGTVTPGALEMSNVEIADEFSKMIMTQNAYNSSATAFRTVDEMTEVARDLKR